MHACVLWNTADHVKKWSCKEARGFLFSPSHCFPHTFLFFLFFQWANRCWSHCLFFLISIRLNSQKPWPYLQNKFKSWKSWLTWTVVQFLALCKQYGRKYQKLRYCWLAKKLLNHTFFVKLRNFKRTFLRSHSIYQAQCFRDNWNCYIFSIFRDFILLASSGNDKHIP